MSEIVSSDYSIFKRSWVFTQILKKEKKYIDKHNFEIISSKHYLMSLLLTRKEEEEEEEEMVQTNKMKVVKTTEEGKFSNLCMWERCHSICHRCT